MEKKIICDIFYPSLVYGNFSSKRIIHSWIIIFFSKNPVVFFLEFITGEKVHPRFWKFFFFSKKTRNCRKIFLRNYNFLEKNFIDNYFIHPWFMWFFSKKNNLFPNYMFIFLKNQGEKVHPRFWNFSIFLLLFFFNFGENYLNFIFSLPLRFYFGLNFSAGLKIFKIYFIKIKIAKTTFYPSLVYLNFENIISRMIHGVWIP